MPRPYSILNAAASNEGVSQTKEGAGESDVFESVVYEVPELILTSLQPALKSEDTADHMSSSESSLATKG